MHFEYAAKQEPRIPSGLVTVDEVAEYLSVSTDFVYELARQGQIPVVRIGRLVRFRLHEVEAVLAVPASQAVNG